MGGGDANVLVRGLCVRSRDRESRTETLGGAGGGGGGLCMYINMHRLFILQQAANACIWSSFAVSFPVLRAMPCHAMLMHILVHISAYMTLWMC